MENNVFFRTFLAAYNTILASCFLDCARCDFWMVVADSVFGAIVSGIWLLLLLSVRCLSSVFILFLRFTFYFSSFISHCYVLWVALNGLCLLLKQFHLNNITTFLLNINSFRLSSQIACGFYYLLPPLLQLSGRS